VTRPQDIGKVFETYWAKNVMGKPVRGSGNKWYARMDVKDTIFLWSAKATEKRSFTINQRMVDEVCSVTTNPGGERRIPALAIRLGSQEYDLVVLRANDFIGLMSDPDSRFIKPTQTEVKRRNAHKPILFRSDQQS
jgi:hypothetical protein